MGKKEQNCKEIFYLRKKLTKINGFEWKKKQKTKSKKKNGEKSKFLILTTYVERKSLYAQQFRKIFKPLFRIRDFLLLSVSLDRAESSFQLCLRQNQWVPCTVHGTHKYFFNKIFIKIGSHSTIYTFKNYFVTVFWVFSFQQ